VLEAAAAAATPWADKLAMSIEAKAKARAIAKADEDAARRDSEVEP
jgi:hypothetical protein